MLNITGSNIPFLKNSAITRQPAPFRLASRRPHPAVDHLALWPPRPTTAKACSAMPRYEFRTPRLHVEAPLAAGATVTLAPPQVNYLGNVLRLRAGQTVLLFNGLDGEWAAVLAEGRKRSLSLIVEGQTRLQTTAQDLQYWFAPLKHARLDYMTQKAIEMGATMLQPLITQHAQVARVNLDRMRSNAIEAAEQCGILHVASVAAPIGLDKALAIRDPSRLLVFCDEDADVGNPIAALAAALPKNAATVPLAVLVGPEGGFSGDERATLLGSPQVVRLALGPRILRADTAAVAALALVQAALGDWR
jgi:16S rRNA (uracil1498-N3)-methyltransferase